MTTQTDPLSQYFLCLNGSDRLRITTIGIERFQQEFAEIGVNVRTIKTKSEFLAAADRSMARKLRQLHSQTSDPTLKSFLDDFYT